MKWPETDSVIDQKPFLPDSKAHSYNSESETFQNFAISQSKSFWSQMAKITGIFLKIGFSYHTIHRYKKTPWLCLNILLQDFNNWQIPTLLQRLNSCALPCHSITNHQQITFTTLSMQTYQQRLGGSLPVVWQQTTGGGIRVVHHS